VEEEGTASTLRALLDVFTAKGLPASLYTDRGSHYFSRPRRARRLTRSGSRQVGRALARLGIEHIPAYSPEARGRSERMFGTLQDRLAKELTLAGIGDVEAANRFIAEVYLPAHNARFARAFRRCPRAPSSSPTRGSCARSCACRRAHRGARQHGQLRRLKLQLPQSPMRPITSRRACGCTNTPTAGSPSSMDRARSRVYTSQGEIIATPPHAA